MLCMSRPAVAFCAGKLVMGLGVAWFSLASLLLPAALSPAVAATGLTFTAVLAARFLVGFGEGVVSHLRWPYFQPPTNPCRNGVLPPCTSGMLCTPLSYGPLFN